MGDDKTLCNIYRSHVTGGPPRVVDDALLRTAAVVAFRRRLVRQFTIPAAIAAAAMTLILGRPLINGVIRSDVARPSASILGCEEATPRIYPSASVEADVGMQVNGVAFMPIGATTEPISESAGCTQQRENL
jgi:hypothetical protein